MLSPALPAAPECKNLTDEFACPLAGAANFGEICRRLPTRPDRGIGHFRITKDCPDDVIEVVGYAAGESANGLHPAGLLQARFQTLLLPFEKDPADCLADRIERHAKQSNFGRSDKGSCTQCIEAEYSVPPLLARV